MTREELKQKRKDLGLSRPEFCRLIVCADQTYAKWLAGSRSIPGYLSFLIELIDDVGVERAMAIRMTQETKNIGSQES